MKAVLLFALFGAILATTSAIEVPYKELHPSGKIPVLGFGTFGIWNVLGGEVEDAVGEALEAGYRLIDTVRIYGNEEALVTRLTVGFPKENLNVVLTKLYQKLISEELFIITKIPPTGNRPRDVERFLSESLTALKTDYVDLLLDHFPFGFQYVPGKFFPTGKDNKLLLDMNTNINDIWKAMEKEVNTGRAKAIGMSNCNITQLERIMKTAEIQPAVIEIELHPYFQQKSLFKFAKENNIEVIGYAPLGSPAINDYLRIFKKRVDLSKDLEDPLVKRLAKKYNKTKAQIVLRHAIQKDLIVIPKSVHPERIHTNIDVFGFKLSEEDMQKLNDLDRGDDGRIFDFLTFSDVAAHPEYPFTSRINHKIKD